MSTNERCCMNCVHYVDDWGTSCDHPDVKRYDDVYGTVSVFTFEARSTDGKCGPDAALFERRLSLFEKIGRLFR